MEPFLIVVENHSKEFALYPRQRDSMHTLSLLSTPANVLIKILVNLRKIWCQPIAPSWEKLETVQSGFEAIPGMRSRHKTRHYLQKG